MKNGRRLQVWFGSLISFLTLGFSLSLAASPTVEIRGSPGSVRLLALIEKRFRNVSSAERMLVAAAADGTDAYCAGPYNENCVIRADLLAWLCIDLDASKQVTSRGVSISAATIRGALDLGRAKISFPLRIVDSIFEDALNLLDTDLVLLDLHGTRVPGLRLGGAKIERSVYLSNGFESNGEVNLVGTRIDGDLICVGGHFVADSGPSALNVDRADIKGGVFLRTPFTAQGEVSFINTKIGSDLSCNGGQFASATDAYALVADGANIGGSIFLIKGFMAQGLVSLIDTTVGSILVCTDAEFVGTNHQPALQADRSKIAGFVKMSNGFKAYGQVRFASATIGSNLECNGGHFAADADQPALNANRANIADSVLLTKGFTAQGGVDLGGARIGSSLDCTGGHFRASKNGVALLAALAKIQNSVVLSRDFDAKEDFSAEGSVILTGATIGGDLNCDGGLLLARDGKATALDAQSAKIDGSVFLPPATSVDGSVSFNFATITRDFYWTPVKLAEHSLLDIQHAKAGSILMKLNEALLPSDISMGAFLYDYIDELSSDNVTIPLRWVALQSDKRFLPQSYEQLSSVLRKMGFQTDATKVMIAKNEEAGTISIAEASGAFGADLRNKKYLKSVGDFLREFWDICWFTLFGRFIGYGYTPWHAFYASLIIILLGYIVFRFAYQAELIIPNDDNVTWRELFATYPKFNAGIYSLEIFVPLVKLGVGDHWIPNGHGGSALRLGNFTLVKVGGLLRGYYWFHIIAGWVLTTLWVGGFTGLIKS